MKKREKKGRENGYEYVTTSRANSFTAPQRSRTAELVVVEVDAFVQRRGRSGILKKRWKNSTELIVFQSTGQ